MKDERSEARRLKVWRTVSNGPTTIKTGPSDVDTALTDVVGL